MTLGVIRSKLGDPGVDERRRRVGWAVGILIIFALCRVLLSFRGRDLAFDGKGDAVGTGNS